MTKMCMTRDFGGVNILSKFQLPSSYRLWFMILWRYFRKSITEWISDEAVCRTAPATPGLSINFFSQQSRGEVHIYNISLMLTNYDAGRFTICIHSVGIGLCKATASSYYPIDQYGATTFPLICMEDTFPNMYPRL